jgi:hypothetical protein
MTTAGTGEKISFGTSGINNLELDHILNSLKEEMKAYAERIVYQNSEKLIEQRHKSEMLLEGRCNAFSVELERKYREMYMEYKHELEMMDTERKLSNKSQQSDLIDQFHKIKGDVTMKLELFEQKELENKMWVERQMQACNSDLANLVDKKMLENESAVRKLLLKNTSTNALQSTEVRSLKEKNLLEYVDTMVRSLKFEVVNEMEDERARKNNRLDEVTRLI